MTKGVPHVPDRYTVDASSARSVYLEATRARGGTGRRARLRAWFPIQGVLVRVQSSAPPLLNSSP